ncbi:MAG: PHP domain-containing protein, partial [Candidatus Eisenbacteria bacterium]|nr:PHP domain-containing protein [Candidatus Eisenbacteria bacterium]
MSDKPFVHLHTHSCYSLLDGAIRVPTLVDAAAEMGMPALALTDHGNMFGIVEFLGAAAKAHVKPIVGSEVYVTVGPRGDRSQGQRNIRHIVLLAKNETGYRNLMQLSTIGYLEGYYYRPRVDHDDLERYSEGLIALSSCLKGEIPQLLLDGRYDEARVVA